MKGMAREKATITLDRAKAAEARAIVGASSTSEVVDLALDQLIRSERLRGDIAAYRWGQPSQAEIDVALLADTGGLVDDVDWDALYDDRPA
jgi:hypothetical protein